MSKGSRRRPTKVDQKIVESNWDRIFNKEKKDLRYESDNPLERPFEPEAIDEKSEEEGLRESIRHQYSESYKPSKWGVPNYEERSLRDIEYSIQYNPPTENN